MPSLPIFSPRRLGLTMAVLLVLVGVVHAAPENLGLGLRELVESRERALQEARVDTLNDEQLVAVTRLASSGQFDDLHRVLVDIYLDGTVPLPRIVRIVKKKFDGHVTGSIDWYRSGTLSAYVPVHQVARLARRAGIISVALSPAPMLHVGKTTSQGFVALHADTVNATYKGTGIAVGVLSDSFATATGTTTTASQDVTNGDLPGTGNPDGYATPVNVLQDDPSAGTDEGRAMCQIVHDLAPASPLAFATGEGGTSNFATNIIALATATGSTYNGKAGAGCKVVCDDLTYSNEPMFSDGVVAQAVDRATALGATYFSSAGNDGNSGYIATFNPQANNSANQALLLSEGGITYGSIPTSETNVISQFHSFGTSGGNPVLVQKVLIPAGGASSGTINFQWDDPSDVLTNGQESVTTDYDLLVFSLSNGTASYLATRSLTAVNSATNEPIEYSSTNLTAGTQYEFVIVRTSRAPTNPAVTPNQATHLRWVVDTDSQQIIADYVYPNSPNSYGHTSAATCNSTAAYQYDKGLNTGAASYTPVIEAYSSNGPADIYFDSAGNRLATPESRKQPTLSAIDGVNTSFFGTDTDSDGFPNFYGTSAASPHAAACAALLLNAANVLNKPVTPADVRDFLVNTTQGSSDQDPGISSATLTMAGVAATTTSVTFTALDHSLLADPYSLNVAFTGTAGQALTSLTITLPSASGSGVAFITQTYPFTAGPATGGVAFTTTPASPANFTNPVTLNFSSFDPGDTLAFGVARYAQVGTSTSYRSATKTDLLAGTALSATVTGGANPGTYTGTLANTISRKWNYKSGYGLIDINAAVNALTSGN